MWINSCRTLSQKMNSNSLIYYAWFFTWGLYTSWCMSSMGQTFCFLNHNGSCYISHTSAWFSVLIFVQTVSGAIACVSLLLCIVKRFPPTSNLLSLEKTLYWRENLEVRSWSVVLNLGGGTCPQGGVDKFPEGRETLRALYNMGRFWMSFTTYLTSTGNETKDNYAKEAW